MELEVLIRDNYPWGDGESHLHLVSFFKNICVRAGQSVGPARP